MSSRITLKESMSKVAVTMSTSQLKNPIGKTVAAIYGQIKKRPLLAATGIGAASLPFMLLPQAERIFNIVNELQKRQLMKDQIKGLNTISSNTNKSANTNSQFIYPMQ
jgi:hypothetical protein